MAGFDDTLTFNTRIDVRGIENGLKSVQNLGDSMASSVDTAMTKTNSEVTETVKQISQLLGLLTDDFEAFTSKVNEENITPKLNDESIKDNLNALQSYTVSLAASITSQIAGAIASALAEIPTQIISLGKDFESSMSQVAATMGITSAADDFADLNNALSSLTEEEKSQVLVKIFNKEDLKSANAILGTSSERFEELTGYISSSEDAAANMAGTMSDTLAGDLDNCSSALDGLAITAYNSLSGTMREAVQAATNNIDRLNESLKGGELSQSMETVSESFSDAVRQISEALSDDILPGVISGLSAVIEHGNTIIGVIAGIGAAIGTVKILEWINNASTAFSIAALKVEAFAASNNIAAMSPQNLAVLLRFRKLPSVLSRGKFLLRPPHKPHGMLYVR